MSRIAPSRLAGFAAEILRRHEVPEASAALVADSLVAADLWGHQSHGVLRLSWYCARLRTGAMSATATPEPVVDRGPLVLLDAHEGMGQVAAQRAMREAVARSREHGVAAVAVRNSNHFGTAMYFTRQAAAAGCAAILTTNASPAMAPWGGKEKRVGTNPWSIAAPGPDGGVVALDIANTAVARGKIYLAQNRGTSIPEGWAMDAEGHQTTDPQAGIDGIILPMAGHKGYAIAFMMDVLSGVLSGSASGTAVHGPYEPEPRSGAGHLFVAIDVAALGDPDGFTARITGLVDEMHDCPTAPGFDEVLVPGELEDRTRAENLAAGGVLLPRQTLADLSDVAALVGLSAPDWLGHAAADGEERP